jgi:hypothetical protein
MTKRQNAVVEIGAVLRVRQLYVDAISVEGVARERGYDACVETMRQLRGLVRDIQRKDTRYGVLR